MLKRTHVPRRPFCSFSCFQCVRPTLRMSLWFQHVDLLHADGGLGFQKEYDYIQAATSDKKGEDKIVTMITITMFDVQQHKAQGSERYQWIKSPPQSSSLMIVGKLDDSNNLTWVDGYQNKNAYVMTNIYRYVETPGTLNERMFNNPKTLTKPLHR